MKLRMFICLIPLFKFVKFQSFFDPSRVDLTQDASGAADGCDQPGQSGGAKAENLGLRSWKRIDRIGLAVQDVYWPSTCDPWKSMKLSMFFCLIPLFKCVKFQSFFDPSRVDLTQDASAAADGCEQPGPSDDAKAENLGLRSWKRIDRIGLAVQDFYWPSTWHSWKPKKFSMFFCLIPLFKFVKFQSFFDPSRVDLTQDASAAADGLGQPEQPGDAKAENLGLRSWKRNKRIDRIVLAVQDVYWPSACNYLKFNEIEDVFLV